MKEDLLPFSGHGLYNKWYTASQRTFSLTSFQFCSRSVRTVVIKKKKKWSYGGVWGRQKGWNLSLGFDEGGSDSSFMLIFCVFVTSVLSGSALKSREPIRVL